MRIFDASLLCVRSPTEDYVHRGIACTFRITCMYYMNIIPEIIYSDNTPVCFVTLSEKVTVPPSSQMYR